jgi:hypothetical protein
VDDAMASITRQLAGTSVKEPVAATLNLVRREVQGSTWTQSGDRRRVTALSEEGGFVIHAGIEELPNGLFRAWAEILKGNRRIERSGLIGPRFESADAATQHAREWACQWITRRGISDCAANSSSVQVVDPQARAMLVTSSDTVVANPAVLGDRLHPVASASDHGPDSLSNNAIVRQLRFNQHGRLGRQLARPTAADVP